ncbi:hypothetical protein [Mucilaginibacter sp. UR6-11]|uniref:hypothetical protein n=1 Tax=Mucilaginibacter sp. UR6-11 TaxID=1435644 RepID=UPI001E3DB885|nr:hypothetical protein [Mucilaginibacter sp. UR6-11]MCC8424822.1 hypothetical protein [Mucilaginibacter sp. UR6-11]
MKITVKALVYSVLFISLGSVANAQINVPDSVRISIGAEITSTTGTDFGTGVNVASGGNAASAYNYGAGLSFHIDVPVLSQLYLTATAGYISFFPTKDGVYSQQAITNSPLPNFNIIPLKIGAKLLLGNRFYVGAEAGETLLANKTALYALYSNSFTWAPQIGLVLPLKKRHTYIDTGLRFESTSSFYNNSTHNTFWGLHVAYAFNL